MSDENLPEGWEETRNSNGAVFHSPCPGDAEKAYRVSWWAAHHNALYIEGYDYAITVPLAVLRALLSRAGLAPVPATARVAAVTDPCAGRQ